MKRHAIGLAALVLLALPAVGQGLSGQWELEIGFSPTTLVDEISTSFSVTYALNSWQVSSVSDFASWWSAGAFTSGWVWQAFGVSGALGPLEVTGNTLFGPLIPDFLYTEVVTGLTFGGIELGLYTAMLGAAVGGYIPPAAGPVGGAAIRVASPVGGGATLTAIIGFGATLPKDGFTIYHVSGLEKTYATDPRPGGFQFTQAEISLTGLSLCCGVTYDFELYFTKAGFQHVEFTVKSLPFCCGISFDASVKFTVTAKQVTITPKWEGIGTACLVVYGDVQYENHTWEGIEIYGWKIRCELAGCAYVESLTALANLGYFWLMPDGSVVYDDEPPFPASAEPLFYGAEFEYLKLGFCGPGCCGGTYSLGIAVYFQPSGGLFGFSRLTADLEIPIMANLTVNVAFTSAPALSFGWTFTF